MSEHPGQHDRVSRHRHRQLLWEYVWLYRRWKTSKLHDRWWGWRLRRSHRRYVAAIERLGQAAERAAIAMRAKGW